MLLFRPEKNAARMQSTHRRLCIPEIPVEDFVQAVKALVSVDKDWVPGEPDTSLYLRPFTIATEAHLGVKPVQAISSSSSLRPPARITRRA